jgi:hypothetical protein
VICLLVAAGVAWWMGRAVRLRRAGRDRHVTGERAVVLERRERR